MSETTKATLDGATGKVSVMLGDQPVDITELGAILTNAGASISECFGTADTTTEWKTRAETAEAKLAQIADLVNFHGTKLHTKTGEMIGINFAHLAKIMNGGSIDRD